MQIPDTTALPADPGAISPAGAAQALQALARSSSARTKAAQLRELLPEIEAAQAAGVRHANILQALNAHGFALSMKSYSVMLHRLRQARARMDAVPAPGAAPPAPNLMTAKHSGAANAPPASAPAAGAPRPGEPQRFDWEALKSVPPEW